MHTEHKICSLLHADVLKGGGRGGCHENTKLKDVL